MSAVLVTGASGEIATSLRAALAPDHDVIGLSRTSFDGPGRPARGTFADPADLAALDAWPLDVAIHLGAVTGGSSEVDAIGVNVAGTRTLLRYLVDRAVKRVVLASSIAAVGCLSPDFRPRQLPIDDDHPCDAVDAYGLSKYLVEEVARYFCRLDPALEITAFRIGAVVPPGRPAPDADAVRNLRLPFTQLGTVALDRVVSVLHHMVTHPAGPGLRVVNLVSSAIPSPWPTVASLRAVLGDEADRYDLDWYGTEGRDRAGLWATDRLRALLGETAGE